MPGKVKVRVVKGRNLPVMDRAADTTDAYVEVKLGNVTHKTDVFRKSLNPEWNSEWFRFEVDDHELQDEPLQIRLMDHDTYSANDAIGKVYVDLNPLLLPPPQPSVIGTQSFVSGRPGPPPLQQQVCASTASTPCSAPTIESSLTTPLAIPIQPALPAGALQSAGPAVMSGWLPVYDTMHGLRGEVEIVLKVDLFSDFNRFRQSSCGVHFFFSAVIPATFLCLRVVGLVEELAVDDDPEYEWRDKIRSPRASNEAKQTLFCKLSGMLQRKIGLKVHNMGGNAVLGYHQCFDLEGESGIVVRGLGTAVVLAPLSAGGAPVQQPPHPINMVHHLHHLGAGGVSAVAPFSRHHSSSPPQPLLPHHAIHQSQDRFHEVENLYVNIPNSDQYVPVYFLSQPTPDDMLDKSKIHRTYSLTHAPDRKAGASSGSGGDAKGTGMKHARSLTLYRPSSASAPAQLGHFAPVYPGNSAQQYPGNSAQQYPGNSAQQYPGNSAQQYPGNPAQQYPGNPVEQYPGNPAQQYPGNPAQQYPGNPAQQYPGNPAQQYPRNPAQQYPRNPAQQYPENPAQQYPENSAAQQYPGYSSEQYPCYSTQQYPDYSSQQYPGYSVQQYPGYSPQQYPEYSTQQYPGLSADEYVGLSLLQQSGYSAHDSDDCSECHLCAQQRSEGFDACGADGGGLNMSYQSHGGKVSLSGKKGHSKKYLDPDVKTTRHHRHKLNRRGKSLIRNPALDLVSGVDDLGRLIGGVVRSGKSPLQLRMPSFSVANTTVDLLTADSAYFSVPRRLMKSLTNINTSDSKALRKEAVMTAVPVSPRKEGTVTMIPINLRKEGKVAMVPVMPRKEATAVPVTNRKVKLVSEMTCDPAVDATRYDDYGRPRAASFSHEIRGRDSKKTGEATYNRSRSLSSGAIVNLASEGQTQLTILSKQNKDLVAVEPSFCLDLGKDFQTVKFYTAVDLDDMSATALNTAAVDNTNKEIDAFSSLKSSQPSAGKCILETVEENNLEESFAEETSSSSEEDVPSGDPFSKSSSVKNPLGKDAFGEKKKRARRKPMKISRMIVDRRVSLAPEEISSASDTAPKNLDGEKSVISKSCVAPLLQRSSSEPNISRSNFVLDWFFAANEEESSGGDSFSGFSDATDATDGSCCQGAGIPTDLSSIINADHKDKVELFDEYMKRKKKLTKKRSIPYTFYLGDECDDNNGDGEEDTFGYHQLPGRGGTESGNTSDECSYQIPYDDHPMNRRKLRRNHKSLSESSTATVVPTVLLASRSSLYRDSPDTLRGDSSYHPSAEPSPVTASSSDSLATTHHVDRGAWDGGVGDSSSGDLAESSQHETTRHDDGEAIRLELVSNADTIGSNVFIFEAESNASDDSITRKDEVDVPASVQSRDICGNPGAALNEEYSPSVLCITPGSLPDINLIPCSPKRSWAFAPADNGPENQLAISDEKQGDTCAAEEPQWPVEDEASGYGRCCTLQPATSPRIGISNTAGGSISSCCVGGIPPSPLAGAAWGGEGVFYTPGSSSPSSTYFAGCMSSSAPASVSPLHLHYHNQQHLNHASQHYSQHYPSSFSTTASGFAFPLPRSPKRSHHHHHHHQRSRHHSGCCVTSATITSSTTASAGVVAASGSTTTGGVVSRSPQQPPSGDVEQVGVKMSSLPSASTTSTASVSFSSKEEVVNDTNNEVKGDSNKTTDNVPTSDASNRGKEMAIINKNVDNNDGTNGAVGGPDNVEDVASSIKLHPVVDILDNASKDCNESPGTSNSAVPEITSSRTDAINNSNSYQMGTAVRTDSGEEELEGGLTTAVCDDGSKTSNSSTKVITKQAAVEGRAEDGSRVNVWENFEYPENRKIQRTATVIEQETIHYTGGPDAAKSETSFTSSIVHYDRKETVVTIDSSGNKKNNGALHTTSLSPTVTPAEQLMTSTSSSESSSSFTAAATTTATPAGGGSPLVVSMTTYEGGGAAAAGFLGTTTHGDFSRATSMPAPPSSMAGDSVAHMAAPGAAHRRFSDCEASLSSHQKGGGVSNISGRYSVAGVGCSQSGANPHIGGLSAVVAGGGGAFVKHPLISYEALGMLKYPFFTMTNFPQGFVLKIGGTVSARCVKLLERTSADLEEAEARNSWWAQLRGEVRMHAKALGCNAVLGYTEFTAICDEVCILNVSGTAAIICVSGGPDPTGFGFGGMHAHHHPYPHPQAPPTAASTAGGGITPSFFLEGGTLDRSTSLHNHHPSYMQHHHYHQQHHHYQQAGGPPAPVVNQSSSFEKKDSEGGSLRGRQTSVSEDADSVIGNASTPFRTPTGIPPAPQLPCSVCHSPFADAAELPFRVAITKCALCRQGKVSDIVLATIEPPPGIPITGRGVLVQARVFKHRRDLKGEQFAKEVSDALPFVEYELTRQIINKVRIAGMNAVFGLRVRLSLGECLVVGVATGTAVYLSALPPPHPPQVASDGFEGAHKRREAQRQLTDTMHSNMRSYGLLEPCRTGASTDRSTASTKESDSEDDDVIPGTDAAGLSAAVAGVPLSAADVAAAGGAAVAASGTEIDFSVGNKEACLLELDDSEDAEMVSLLLHCCSPTMQRMPLATTHTVPGIPMPAGDSASSASEVPAGVQMFTKVYRETFSVTQALTQMSFNAYFDNVIQSICYRMKKLQPCVITGLRFDVEIPDEDELQLTVLGAVVRLPSPSTATISAKADSAKAAPASTETGGKASSVPKDQNGALQPLQEMNDVTKNDDGEMIFKMEEVLVPSEDSVSKSKSQDQSRASLLGSSTPGRASAQIQMAPSAASSGASRAARKITYASSSSSSSGSISRPQLQHQARVQATPSLSSFQSAVSVPSVPSTASLSSGGSGTRLSFSRARRDSANTVAQPLNPSWQRVFISPLPFVPGTRIERHLGNLNFFFIRESNSIKELGGVSVFAGSLVTEVLGIVRAHVAALGGSALTSYFMAECMLECNLHKNQGQFLINIGGDVVQTSLLTPPPPPVSAPPAAAVTSGGGGEKED